jgi:ribosomal protein S18 acetylase RimI-like enzyme
MRIVEWLPTSDDGIAAALAEILHACVHNGASVGFILPFALADAQAYWRDSVLPRVASGQRVVWLASVDDRIAGTVSLDIGTFPNQAHRADVMKLLVHPDMRRRGIARALMLALEARAALEGRTLLTLDTRSGDAAEPLYLDLGYEFAGRIPGYARNPATPDLEATTILYKRLPSPAAPQTDRQSS